MVAACSRVMTALRTSERMSKEKPRDQISVKLDPELRAAVEQAAQAEHRTVSAQVRHFVACMIEARQPANQATT
jgi:hypothetical protein